ncbi:hypothetical protein [Paenibacillus sp. CMAA1364]
MNKFLRKVALGSIVTTGAVIMSSSITFANYTDELDQVTNAAKQMDSTSQRLMIGQSLNGIDTQSMDLETAMLAVQSERAKLLDTQLKTQMESVQNRNLDISKLNQELLEAQSAGDTQKVASLKSQIDAMSNSQQMDTLRLQSLSNKRNESFEIMTNFIKKMQDNRSSIIGNMR